MPSFHIEVDTRQTVASLNAAAKAANREAVKGVRRATKGALPIVRAEVARKLPGTTHAGATNNGAYYEQRHPGAPIVNYGGERNDEILPIKGRALVTPEGPRAAVTGSRTYRKTLALNNAVDKARPALVDPTQKAILDAYRPYFPVS